MKIRQMNLEVIDSDIFKNFEVEGDEVVQLSYSKQIDDIMITVEGGDVLLRWDTFDWVEDEAMLLKEKDNWKEINDIQCTHFMVKSKDGNKVKVYTVTQIN